MSDSSQPRHWHGSVGDRYEHSNVWVRGGPATAYRRPSASAIPATASASTVGHDMNDRRGSAASDMSAGSMSSSANTGSSPPGRRRSSGHGPSTLFESLTSQKRTSEDASAAARRASYTDQAQKGGFFSKWWEGYTRGQ
ncbi:hypothetical protein BJX96DRAFT_147998 [Aspergillus floccosus]